MPKILAEDEVLVPCAVMGLRGPDGSVVENVPLYRVLNKNEVSEKSGLTPSQEDDADYFATQTAPKLKKLIDDFKKTQKGNVSE